MEARTLLSRPLMRPASHRSTFPPPSPAAPIAGPATVSCLEPRAYGRRGSSRSHPAPLPPSCARASAGGPRSPRRGYSGAAACPEGGQPCRHADNTSGCPAWQCRHKAHQAGFGHHTCGRSSDTDHEQNGETLRPAQSKSGCAQPPQGAQGGCVRLKGVHECVPMCEPGRITVGCVRQNI